MVKKYLVRMHRDGYCSKSPIDTKGTLEELKTYFKYTLECGESYQSEKGNHKINVNPKTISSLIKNVNWAMDNSAANGYSGRYLELVSEAVE